MLSKIERTGETWNPMTGCTQISEGCANCYAKRMHARLQAMNSPKYAQGFDKVVCHESELDKPRHWKKPRTIFVCSMSDLFHKDVPADFIVRVFDVMKRCPQHTFQILTKRAERMREVIERNIIVPRNVWLGVTIEQQKHIDRVVSLQELTAPHSVKFISCEPLLECVGLGLNLDGISWVIVGGESGPGARPMDLAWVRCIRDQCIAEDTLFFFKQMSARKPIPQDLMIRQFPEKSKP